jgi:hypothetical protein
LFEAITEVLIDNAFRVVPPNSACPTKSRIFTLSCSFFHLNQVFQARFRSPVTRSKKTTLEFVRFTTNIVCAPKIISMTYFYNEHSKVICDNIGGLRSQRMGDFSFVINARAL